jgi:two-component system cell cycle sensor histidine kinase/response regulator CckA
MMKKKILIVEDERITAEAIKRTLEYLGYPDSWVVTSGEAAVEEAKKNSHDLVLMDMKLKGDIDGIEAVRSIRSHSDIPVIYITAITDKATLEQAKKTEPYGYIHKPIEEKELFSTIEMAFLRHELERQLKESEQRYRELVEKAGIGILIDDIEGTILYSNEKAAELYGYSIEEMKKQSIKSLVHPDDIKMVTKFHKDRVQGKSVSSRYVFRGIRKDGSIRYLELDANFYKKGDEVIGTRLYIKDITERIKAEEEKEKLQSQLAHSEKMAGIGTLAGGIAHEFNNILQIMGGHVEFAQRTKKPEDIDEALNVVTFHADKAAKIIKDLLTFSSAESSDKKKRANIAELIDSVLLLTEEHFKKHNIEVVRKFQKVPQVEVNRGELQQVFLNMITNARDAMFPQGGKLAIEVKGDGNRVETSFTDTGIGIKKENLRRIFEPFYTTKGSVGKGDIPGTGLGLSVSYGIVKRHEGTIEVKSQKGKGTTFTVTLPLNEKKLKKPTQKK